MSFFSPVLLSNLIIGSSFPQTRVLFFIYFEDIRIVMTREYEDSSSFVATLSIPNSTLNANVFIGNMQMNRQSYVQ